MAKLPTIRRLLLEDFRDQNQWIGRLLDPVNSFQEGILSSINKSLTIMDNMAGQIVRFTLDGTFPVRAAWPLKAAPVVALKGQLVRVDGTAFTLAAAFDFQWSFTQSGQLQIDSVVGVTPSATAKYALTLVCLTG